MQPILSLDNISYSYHSLKGETPALSDISFSVPEGEFLAIVGPSGCGKSTLLSIIAGLLKPAGGSFTFRARSTIGYMLQHDHLFEWRSIYQNVILGLELNKNLTRENTDYVIQLLKDYGLYAFKDKKPSELSGGMRQRAALIRTMAIKPELLLLDEPFSALDFQTRLTVSVDIGNIIRNTGKTAILITHDLSEAITLADRVIVLSKRPATIKYELPICYDIDRTSPLSIRNTAQYQTYFNLLWKELSDDLSYEEKHRQTE
ncbi:MAG: ABC transporter ATP-binding protein [Roseburia sp.]|nr:ABC transporter ATP-binding protein [Ruminococcus sp.]MCM1155318.1 ABC transporter ATP-binding protein [Roseburia sp.]MCM1243013.1 ABC transporter ATP-binding protein [Roseburia sp.]